MFLDVWFNNNVFLWIFQNPCAPIGNISAFSASDFVPYRDSGLWIENKFLSRNVWSHILNLLCDKNLRFPNQLFSVLQLTGIRQKSICTQANDGYPGSSWSSDVCDALSVFWLANIQNFVHDNAAVGGHVGYWSFTHTSTQVNPSVPDSFICVGYRWRQTNV